MPRFDGHSLGQTEIRESWLGPLSRIELCSAITTLAVMAATALIVCLH